MDGWRGGGGSEEWRYLFEMWAVWLEVMKVNLFFLPLARETFDMPHQPAVWVY